MTKPVLIVIDVQNGFNDPILGKRSTPQLSENITKVLSHWRKNLMPIIHVRHHSMKIDSPLRPGQNGHDFMSFAQPLPGEKIFEKIVHSAFIGTELQKYLFAREMNKIVIVGIATDHCVSTTARMACDYGYDVTVLSDATAAFERNLNGEKIDAEVAHKVALAGLNEEFATIASVEQMIKSAN